MPTPAPSPVLEAERAHLVASHEALRRMREQSADWTQAVAGDSVTCGCCGRGLPRGAVHELGGTPGTYVCRRCAWWMAIRMRR